MKAMLPQPASDRTIGARNSVKQGVVRVPKVKGVVVYPDGREVPLEELTDAERKNLAQKVNDLLTPLAYELVMKDLRRERGEAG